MDLSVKKRHLLGLVILIAMATLCAFHLDVVPNDDYLITLVVLGVALVVYM